jgi:hypothetical protein
MRGTARSWRRMAVVTLLAGLLATPTMANGRGGYGGRGGGFAAPQPGLAPRAPLYGPAGPSPLNPAGPSPLNPAGPSPLNPAGPSPLNPTGPSLGMPRRGFSVRQPGAYVGVVGSSYVNGGAPLRGSFYCQVHNRGYASQALFFDHLAVADGIGSEEARSYLVEDGGVWVFPVE